MGLGSSDCQGVYHSLSALHCQPLLIINTNNSNTYIALSISNIVLCIIVSNHLRNEYTLCVVYENNLRSHLTSILAHWHSVCPYMHHVKLE